MTFDVAFKEAALERLLWAVPSRKHYVNGKGRLAGVRNATLYGVESNGAFVPGLVRIVGPAEVITSFDIWSLWQNLDEAEPEDDWPCDIEHTFWSRWFPRWFRPRRVPQQYAPDQHLPFDAVVPTTDIVVGFPRG